ncbi:hypothetical protein ZWY2020_057145 [Hordeum vulgare]|nr:hypothetical protein ZWY2020_057145 [Hordeum vulgare]
MEGGSKNPSAHAPQSSIGWSHLSPTVDAELSLVAIKKKYAMLSDVVCRSIPLDEGKSASELKALYASMGHHHEEKVPNYFVRIMEDSYRKKMEC